MVNVIKDMISPLIIPTLSNPINNADGSFKNRAIIEIGTTLNGPVTVQVAIDDTSRLDDPAYNATTNDGLFNNEGDFPLGDIVLTLQSPISPVLPQVSTISVFAKYGGGQQSEPVETYIEFAPQIFWGVSPLEDLTPAEAAAIPFKQSIVSSEYKQDYSYNAAGYLWLFLPTMLPIQNPIFLDVSPDAIPGATIGMEDKGVANINNGTATLEYQQYRSKFEILSNLTIIRVA